LRIKEQEKHLTLNEHDDDDDDEEQGGWPSRHCLLEEHFRTRATTRQ